MDEPADGSSADAASHDDVVVDPPRLGDRDAAVHEPRAGGGRAGRGSGRPATSTAWGRPSTACWSGTAPSRPAASPTSCSGCSRGIFPAPRRLRRSIDPALEAICLKAMALQPEDRHATPLALAEEIEAWLADVRYRSEQEQATPRREAVAGPALHRAGTQPLRPGDARRGDALAGPCPGEHPAGLAGPRARRPREPGRLACRGEADGTHPLARRRRPRRGVQPRRAEAGDRVRGSDGAALGRRQGRAALGTDSPREGRPRDRVQPGRDDWSPRRATTGRCGDGMP